ncbi:MAG: 30S ribosomal protein S9 [Nitrososphaeria archaeon]|nr:30S ribosomal protein S9 [Nitrososphaeria archaeon]
MAKKVVQSDGWRKTAYAQATVTSGQGRVWINNVPIEILQPEFARLRIMTPLLLAKEISNKVDINVKVRGGGFMSRAEACAMAISRGLVEWSGSEELKKRFLDYDRYLIVGDPRQTEPKKFGGPGPRRRRQKSYR